MDKSFVNFVYLISSSLFIFGLKNLAHPRTAVRGNLLGALGMFIALVITLLDKQVVRFETIIAGFLAGTAIGVIISVKAKMTAMPQTVALLIGIGGGAATLVSGAAFAEAIFLERYPTIQFSIATAASGCIGSMTFWGSLLAFGKLQGITTEKAVRYTGQDLLNAVLGILIFSSQIHNPRGNGYDPWCRTACRYCTGLRNGCITGTAHRQFPCRNT